MDAKDFASNTPSESNKMPVAAMTATSFDRRSINMGNGPVFRTVVLNQGQRDMPSSILQRIASGDKRAVDDCISCYGAIIWSIARKHLGNRQDAEDTVQEVFIELWRTAQRYDPSIASELTFITTLTRRRIIDKYRSNARKPTQPIEGVDIASRSAQDEEWSEVNEEAKLAREGMKQLKPEERTVLTLCVEQGLSHSEVAERMQMALGTVKSHARRGLLRLREFLSGHQSAKKLEAEQ